MEKRKNKKQRNKKSLIFFVLIVILYGVVAIIFPEKAMPILKYFVNISSHIIPVLFLIYVIMVLVNYFLNNEKLKKYMGEDAGIKGWLISIIAGIVSVGSIYVWYPLLKELKQKGVKDKFIVTFLYNRGIKLQLLPVLLFYYGWKFSITLLIVMAVISVFQGIVAELLIDHCCVRKHKTSS